MTFTYYVWYSRFNKIIKLEELLSISEDEILIIIMTTLR